MALRIHGYRALIEYHFEGIPILLEEYRNEKGYSQNWRKRVLSSNGIKI